MKIILCLIGTICLIGLGCFVFDFPKKNSVDIQQTGEGSTVEIIQDGKRDSATFVKIDTASGGFAGVVMESKPLTRVEWNAVIDRVKSHFHDASHDAMAYSELYHNTRKKEFYDSCWVYIDSMIYWNTELVKLAK